MLVLTRNLSRPPPLRLATIRRGFEGTNRSPGGLLSAASMRYAVFALFSVSNGVIPIAGGALPTLTCTIEAILCWCRTTCLLLSQCLRLLTVHSHTRVHMCFYTFLAFLQLAAWDGCA